MGILVDAATPSQKIAGGISMALSFVAMVLGFMWGRHSFPTDSSGNVTPNGWLGGMGTDFPHWKCTVHAVLMIFAMCFCYSHALVSYRVYHFLGHTAAKVIHGCWHVLTFAIMMAAIVLIIQFHNEVGMGHLFSFHSWMGIVTLGLYSQNWVLGVVSFALPNVVSPAWKKQYMPSHRFLGIMGAFSAAVTMRDHAGTRCGSSRMGALWPFGTARPDCPVLFHRRSLWWCRKRGWPAPDACTPSPARTCKTTPPPGTPPSPMGAGPATAWVC
jgi:Eukaryotic cytochrome b561